MSRLRRTGRSTRIAIATINEAMQNPGKKIKVADHHPTRMADLYLGAQIMVIIDRLELTEFFTYDNGDLTLEYRQ